MEETDCNRVWLGPTVNDALAAVGKTSVTELADKYGEIGFQWKHEYEADLAGMRYVLFTCSSQSRPSLPQHLSWANIATFLSLIVSPQNICLFLDTDHIQSTCARRI
jgi:hypothetical protein